MSADEVGVAVVTGAGRGIGAAVAIRLAGDGWALALGDVCHDDPAIDYPMATEEDLERTVTACRDAGSPAVVGRRCDVRDADQVTALVEAGRHLGPVTAAVGVAGVLAGSGTAWTLSDDLMDRDLDVNYRGVVRLARSAVPDLLEARRRGRFVAVVSVAGEQGLPLLASYVASKHALLGYVRSLAADLAWSGVTVNAVLPGSTDTPLLDATARAYGLQRGAELAQHSRTGRLMEPGEIAAGVGWLLSPGATGITGAAVRIDGGFTG